MMKFTAATAVAAVASANMVTPEILSAFKDFQVKFGKNYANDAEWAKRVGIFALNVEKVTAQNKDHLLTGGDAVFGITKFMDLTVDEFRSQYLTYIPSTNSTVERVAVTAEALADEVDWRTKNAVTAVKDQGQCGSCWAFSATEAIESYAFLAGKELQELSPQQINSCDKVDQGCNGGNTETAYAYVMKAGGLELEKDYPYTSGTTQKSGACTASGDKAQNIAGFTAVKKGEKNLLAALNNGPVSVCVAAESFQTYSKGILKTCKGRIDHCVQAVGYSTPDNYWLVRNSWGTVWGEDGYIRIEMGKDLCDIADDVTFPTF